MTREEAIKWIDDRMCFGRGTFTEHHPPNIDECWQAGMMAIEALTYKNLKKPNNTCEVDLISRVDAIEAVWRAITSDELVQGSVEEEILKLPSADAVQGEWICKGDYAVCSKCGGSSGTQFDGVEPIPKTTAFCPNCGARMKGGDTE